MTFISHENHVYVLAGMWGLQTPSLPPWVRHCLMDILKSFQNITQIKIHSSSALIYKQKLSKGLISLIDTSSKRQYAKHMRSIAWCNGFTFTLQKKYEL